MLFREMPTLALWHLHHGSGRSLAGLIIPMVERGLQVHLFACRGPDGAPTVAVLGMDGGMSRAYAEVVLTDLDAGVWAAWWVLRADDTIARARHRLVEVDAILNGTAVPERNTGKVVVTEKDHLMLVMWAVPNALMDVGFEDAAAAVRRRATDLHADGVIEDLVILLGKIGVELTKAYVRAGGYVRRAPDGIRDDALKYEDDLFTAKCHVAVARAAARRVMRKDAWGLN